MSRPDLVGLAQDLRAHGASYGLSCPDVTTKATPDVAFLRGLRARSMDRFWSYVQPEPNTGCWLWGGPESGDGYGTFYAQGRVYRAHRAAYTLFVGDPAGLLICHRCDTPLCVNPGHLYAGTHADNVRDCVRRGRNHIARGTQHGNAKLTPEQVRSIRNDRESFQADLADAYGVSQSLISLIKRREAWRHV